MKCLRGLRAVQFSQVAHKESAFDAACAHELQSLQHAGYYRKFKYLTRVSGDHPKVLSQDKQVSDGYAFEEEKRSERKKKKKEEKKKKRKHEQKADLC
jgi:hypothetical protein